MAKKKAKAEREWGTYDVDDYGDPIFYAPLHVGQQKVIDQIYTDKRNIVYITGKGSGKTSTGPLIAHLLLLLHPGKDVLVISPTAKMMHQSIWKEFHKHFCGQCELRGEWNIQRQTFEMKGGSTIFFRSADDPETLNGIHAVGVLIDEGLLLSRDTFEIIQSRVAQKQAKIFILSTPYKGQQWVEEVLNKAPFYRPAVYPYTEELYRRGDPDWQDWFVVAGPSTMNPSFTVVEFERLKRITSDWRFKLDYLGEPAVNIEGLCLPELKDCAIPQAKLPGQQLPQGKYVGGIDFSNGGKAPNVALAGVLDKNNVLWIFWEFSQRPKNTESSVFDFANVLKSWHNDFYQDTGSKVTFLCDSAVPVLRRQLSQHKLGPNDNGPKLKIQPVRKTGGSIDEGIDLITNRIKSGKLKLVTDHIEPGKEPWVKALIQESCRYGYDDHGKRKGEHDAIDALRYIVLTIDRRKGLIQ